jgi:ABC-2 type transport system permease protein
MNQLRSLYWLVRRELWENKALWIAPAVTAGLLLVATVWGFIAMISNPEAVEAFNEYAVPELLSHGTADLAHGFSRAGIALLYLVMLVVLFFYILDSLYGERRDRSILFWRSLPVSDTLTVASKVTVAIVVAPLIVVAIALCLEVVDVLISGPIVAMGTDLRYGDYVQPLASLSAVSGGLRDMWLLGLWFLPYIGWLFLVSAWARRAAFLWAILPPLGLGLAEYLMFRSRHFFEMIGHHLSLPFQGCRSSNLVSASAEMVSWPRWGPRPRK